MTVLFKLVFHSLKTLLFDLGLISNYFSLKDRIHTKVPQQLHWNFCLELFGCKKFKHFWRCEKWSRRSWKSFMFKHVWRFLPHDQFSPIFFTLWISSEFMLTSFWQLWIYFIFDIERLFLKYFNAVQNFMKSRLNLNCAIKKLCDNRLNKIEWLNKSQIYLRHLLVKYLSSQIYLTCIQA